MTLPIPYTHTDGRTLHLGKGPARIDSRTFKLSDFLKSPPPPPAAINWYKGVADWGAMLNDELGDCVCAAIGHADQVATLNTPEGELTVNDDVIENVYEMACGYNPSDPSTDNGCVIVDTLNWVRKYGLGKRHTAEGQVRHRQALYAYADPDPGDITHVKQAIASFGILDVGLQLPLTAQNQVGSLWTVVGDPNTNPNSEPGSWGGHSIVICAYDAEKLIGITWGQLQPMTWQFFGSYVDECHALLMDRWMDSPAAAGIDLAAMEQALQALGN